MEIRFSTKNLALAAGIAGVLGSGLLLTGCDLQDGYDLQDDFWESEPEPLRCATVDTTKVLQLDPEYQNLAQEYFNARVKLAGELQETLTKNGGTIKDQATYDKFIKAEHELNSTWMGITRQFTAKKMDSVTSACSKLTEQKGFDIVLLDSSEIATVEYGAIDITADVLVELSSFAGTDQKGEAKSGEAKSTDAEAKTPASTDGSSQAESAAKK